MSMLKTARHFFKMLYISSQRTEMHLIKADYITKSTLLENKRLQCDLLCRCSCSPSMSECAVTKRVRAQERNCLTTNLFKCTVNNLPLGIEQHREGDKVLLGEACVVNQQAGPEGSCTDHRHK